MAGLMAEMAVRVSAVSVLRPAAPDDEEWVVLTLMPEADSVLVLYEPTATSAETFMASEGAGEAVPELRTEVNAEAKGFTPPAAAAPSAVAVHGVYQNINIIVINESRQLYSGVCVGLLLLL